MADRRKKAGERPADDGPFGPLPEITPGAGLSDAVVEWLGNRSTKIAAAVCRKGMPMTFGAKGKEGGR